MSTLKYDAGAGSYDRLTGRWSRVYVDRVLDLANVARGTHVLDVATGTGDAAIAAADRVGDEGRVVAVDISAPMLEVAAVKAAGRQIEFSVADAQCLPYAEGSFDAIVCLFGMMFIPDQIAALSSLRRLLRPDGRLVATSWDIPERAQFAGLVAQALAEQLPGDRADLLRPFSLSDPNWNRALYEAARFTDISLELLTFPSPFTSFDGDFWEPIEAGGGRLGQAYRSLPPPARRAAREAVLRQLPVQSTWQPFTLQHSAWVAVASST